ncbi:MAG: rhomboid family intramembrane serine protease [Chloroflexi bacterium]|nr:rhomboid family intramembrane serine protease [Chloroflexota bacterium]
MSKIRGFKKFLLDMLGLFWFALKIGLGLLIAVALIRLLNSATWEALLDRLIGQTPVLENLETAVRVVTGFFLGTWGVRFLDSAFLGNRLHGVFALQKGGRIRPLNLFTYAFAHNDDAHLHGNTLMLLLFAGVALLMVPSMQLFVLATIIILLVNAGGILLFGPKGPYVGASGLLLGYFSFLEAFGLVVAGGWRAVVAIILLLIFGLRIFRIMTNRSNRAAFIGHLWGFIAGLLAARALLAVLAG